LSLILLKQASMCKSNVKKIRDFDSFYDLITYSDTKEKCQQHLAGLCYGYNNKGSVTYFFYFWYRTY